MTVVYRQREPESFGDWVRDIVKTVFSAIGAFVVIVLTLGFATEWFGGIGAVIWCALLINMALSRPRCSTKDRYLS